MSNSEKMPKNTELSEGRNETKGAQTAKELKSLAANKSEQKVDKADAGQVDKATAIQSARETIETQASSKAEKQDMPQETAETETTPEAAGETTPESQDKDQERSQEVEAKEKAEKSAERSQEKKAAKSNNKRKKQQVYQKTMQDVQRHLSPAQRRFSKFAHARPVEFVSEVLEETILRLSFIWGGVIGALVLGGGVYITARIIGFELSGSEFTLGLLLGGLVGFVLERLIGLFRHKRA